MSQEQQLKPGGRQPGAGCSLIFWCSVVGITCLVMYLNQIGVSWWRILGLLFLMMLTVVFLLYFWVRWKMRHLQQFMKLVNSGDIDHAVTLMEREMERKGESADRLNLLATLYGTAHRWEDGLRVLEKSEEYGELAPMSQSNRAIFLKHLGRDVEALEIIEKLVETHPNEFLFQTNFCTLLYETGRTHEAREQLKIVENLYESQPPARFPYEQERRHQLLQECRATVLGEGEATSGEAP